MLLATGCSGKNFSPNIDLTETTSNIAIEITTESIEDSSMTAVTAEQYLRDNRGDENDCSEILKVLPSEIKGKWLVTEGLHLRAVERIEESMVGTIIEFSDKAIKVNGEELVDPFISRDEVQSYDFLYRTRKINVWKIGMDSGDYARYITIGGRLESTNDEYYIPILYFNGKFHLMCGCDYGMEKCEDKESEVLSSSEQ